VYSVYEPLINFVLLKNLYALLYFAGLKLTEAFDRGPSELKVSGLIILHRIRVSFLEQGLYKGLYRRFYECGPPHARAIQE
jgi:hypothetical protein